MARTKVSRAAPSALLLLCAACAQTPFAQPPAMVSLAVSPGSLSLVSGKGAALAAKGRFADGSAPDVTALVVWSSSDPAVAAVDAAGAVRGLSAGTAIVTATSGAFSASAPVQVTAPVPAGLVISPATASLATGAQQQFTVTGTRLTDGTLAPPPASVTWSSSVTETLSIDAAGLARALAAGTAVVIAAGGGLTGTAAVTVGPPVDVSLVVAPATAVVAKGLTQGFTVTGTVRSDGSAGPAPRPITWSAASAAVANIDSSGLATGRGLGTTAITAASAAGLKGTAALEVTAPVAFVLLIAPADPVVTVGTTLQLSVTNTVFSDGSLGPPPAQVSWVSAAPGFATVGADGLVSGLKAGTALVTASAGALHQSVTVTVQQSKLASIAITPLNLHLARRGTAQLTATGTYSDGSTADLTRTATWTSSDPKTVLLGGSGTVPAPGFATAGLVAGAAKITAAQAGVSATVLVNVDAVRVAFATSASGTANLSTWQLSLGFTGLAAADAICTTSALKAGYPAKFTAWLSDSKTDAYCRIHGASGQRSANCGQTTLPASAGPWARTDGLPFAASLADLMARKVLYPVSLDESGQQQPLQNYFTGSDEFGAVYFPKQSPCTDWTRTNLGDLPWVGSVTGGGVQWSRFGTVQCSDYSRLLCLETGNGSGPGVPDWRQSGKLAFVSSALGPGDLGSWPQAAGQKGTAAGDAICQTLAGSAGYKGTFKAWLGDENNLRPSARFTGNGPWVRVDGVKVAASASDLWNNALTAPVELDENGTSTGGYVVWTGSVGPQGNVASSSCTSWTTASRFVVGQYGLPDESGTYWGGWRGTNAPCDGGAHLYCFEQ